LRSSFDPNTHRSVALERALQAALGAGCHTATAAHVFGEKMLFFDERTGLRSVTLTREQLANPAAAASGLLAGFGIP
jgi:hydroxymethylbilane synthase